MGCRQRPRGITVSRLIAAIALLAALPALAVPSPASLAFREDRSRRASGDSPLAPSFIDLRALAEGYRLAPKAKDAEPLPSSWDARDEGWVSPVKNQRSYGTCWAFATMACLETAVLRATDGVVTNDFSENHLAANDVFTRGFDDGGNNDMAYSMLLSWRDPICEQDDPYPNPSSEVSLPAVGHVQEAVWLPTRTDASDNDAIKRAIREYGAVAAAYCHKGAYLNPHTGAYFYSGTNDSNHAIAIVGWDDDYPVENFLSPHIPDEPGAFLIKNSWGLSSDTTNGYFWISYSDSRLCVDAAPVAYPTLEPTNNFGRVYQYDPCGPVTDWNAKPFSDSEQLEDWFGNVFRADATCRVSAVGFYVHAPNSSYTVRLYTGCSDVPTSGTLAAEVSGRSDRAGYITVPLGKEVAIDVVGERFAAVVRLESPGVEYPMSCESYAYDYCDTDADYGQSFYSQDCTTWYDLQNDDPFGNFCIKAYTAFGSDGEPRGPTNLYVDCTSVVSVPDGTEERPFPTIQSALDHAFEGDTVIVRPGVYGPVTNHVRGVYVRSTDGAAATVIDGAGVARCVDDYSVAAFFGFTLANGLAEGCGGGAYGGEFCACVISNCVARFGGGVAYASLVNCLLVDNAALTDGGGAYESSVVNCTLVRNEAGRGGGGLYLDYEGLAFNCVFAFNTSAGVMYGNDLYDACSGYAMKCFIGGEPGFVDPANGDWRLAPGSPCIDAGYDGIVNPEYADLDGRPRIVGGAVDLGCYEADLVAGFAETNLFCGAVESTLELRVVADGAWSLASEDDWLVPAVSGGSGSASVAVIVAANATGARRTGRIVLTPVGCDACPVAEVLQVAGNSRGRTYHGLFVGVSNYSWRLKLAPLGGCVYDAQHLHERAIGSGLWHPVNATVLTNGSATVSAVRARLADLATRAEPGDVVLYAHSSHGEIAPYDQLEAALYGYDGAYTDTALAEDLAKFNPRVTVIVFIDACHSAGMYKSSGPSALTAVDGGFGVVSASNPGPSRSSLSRDFAERVMAKVAEIRSRGPRVLSASPRGGTVGGGIAFITAADYDQLSWDLTFGGAFTTAFTEGWRTGDADADDDGRLDFLELFRYGAALAGGMPEYSPLDLTEPQCLNEPLLLETLAEVVDPRWPDPGVEETDAPETVAAKVAAALEEVGYSPSFAAQVKTEGQYEELAKWSETTGLTPSEQESAGAAPLLSAALWADGLLTPSPDAIRITSLERFGDGLRLTVSLAGYDVRQVNAGLLASALGYVSAPTLETLDAATRESGEVGASAAGVQIDVPVAESDSSRFIRVVVR